VCCPGNTFTSSFDFREDRIRGGRPEERLRLAVGILDVVIDFLDQVFHAAKGSPANGLLRNAVAPDFHLIEPGGIGRSEVHMESWSCGEPAPHSQMLVRGVIIHDVTGPSMISKPGRALLRFVGLGCGVLRVGV
jgi:hypothetical protein